MAKAMGQDPAEQKYVPFKITDRKFVENYFKLLHHPLEKQGLDFWWLDWQQKSNTDVAGVNPAFCTGLTTRKGASRSIRCRSIASRERSFLCSSQC
jgi:alpha-glucosidase (family GH31 glycosyl hydrolase)